MTRSLLAAALCSFVLVAACGPAESSSGPGGQAGQAQGAGGSNGAAGSSASAGSSSGRTQCVTLVNIKKYIADGLEKYCLPCLMTVPSCCTALAACDADANCPTCIGDTVAASELCVDNSTFSTTPPYSDVIGCDSEGVCLSKCSAGNPDTCNPGDPGYPHCY